MTAGAGPTSLNLGLAAQMRHLTARQQVVAGNIANADTPGYRARDLARPNFAALVRGAAAGGGSPQIRLSPSLAAMGATAPMSAGAGRVVVMGGGEVKPNGNNVGLEDQLLAMGQIQADFALTANLYRQRRGLLASALGRPRG